MWRWYCSLLFMSFSNSLPMVLTRAIGRKCEGRVVLVGSLVRGNSMAVFQGEGKVPDASDRLKRERRLRWNCFPASFISL